MRSFHHCAAWLLSACIAILSAPTAGLAQRDRAVPYVDLELVLAVDISLSMDTEEQRLQRDGYVAAFRDSALHKAIKSGPNGRIAVTYVEWAGHSIQSVIVPWHVIGSAREANAFADTLSGHPIARAMMTSISQAVLTSQRLFSQSGVRGLRRVIDVSGDGPNNTGGPIVAARDKLVASGITINGLAIQIKQGTGPYSYFDLPDLDRYYKACVIGGPGSFVLTIRKKTEFATAIRKKLLLEIAGLTPAPPARLHRTQATADGTDPYDCLIGEKMWQQYLLDAE